MTRDTVTVYRDKTGDWRWRRVAANGRVVATSGEGYRNRAHAEKMARKINLFTKVKVVEREP